MPTFFLSIIRNVYFTLLIVFVFVFENSLISNIVDFKASTIDGQRLSSEDAIAEYIASMLLLETDPVRKDSKIFLTR